jgi:hypothetical protein
MLGLHVFNRAGLAKLDNLTGDKKSLVVLAQSAQEGNDETTQKKSRSRLTSRS